MALVFRASDSVRRLGSSSGSDSRCAKGRGGGAEQGRCAGWPGLGRSLVQRLSSGGRRAVGYGRRADLRIDRQESLEYHRPFARVPCKAARADAADSLIRYRGRGPHRVHPEHRSLIADRSKSGARMATRGPARIHGRYKVRASVQQKAVEETASHRDLKDPRRRVVGRRGAGAKLCERLSGLIEPDAAVARIGERS